MHGANGEEEEEEEGRGGKRTERANERASLLNRFVFETRAIATAMTLSSLSPCAFFFHARTDAEREKQRKLSITFDRNPMSTGG